jgi:D-alanyl-D-alanine carboxypeptidase/lipoprotein-anchoring transpeptidase ErfK/SrfK
MYNEEPKARRFYAISYDEDEPTISLGAFIPPRRKTSRPTVSFTPHSVSKKPTKAVGLLSPYVLSVKVVSIVVSFTALAFVGLTATPYLRAVGETVVAQIQTSQTTTPTVIVENPYTAKQTPLNYGVQVALSEPNFFIETRSAFIESGQTFLEADLTTMQLRYFEAGVLTEQVAILSKGKEGSWWETPAGLYAVQSKKSKHFSSFGQVYTPWNMVFQGNFFIHGWPYYPDGTPVPAGFSGGCIRLSDVDAEKIYNRVSVNTPILVHEQLVQSDGFVYEPKIPELDTPHYLIADVESSTVLASSELTEAVPIASLTKLMTALIAAEYINLDTSVAVTQPTFATSLIPRLGARNSVSMYSLLQLLLVESSNEAAEVIANQLGQEQFVRYMNDKAAALGLMNTHFADPSGLSAANTSSLRDLLSLTQYIFNNRRFIIELTANQDLPTAYVSGEFGELSNFNKVEALDNFIGGKVGETTAAGQTSITLHKLKVKGVERVIAIILLNSNSRNADVKELLGYATERFGY